MYNNYKFYQNKERSGCKENRAPKMTISEFARTVDIVQETMRCRFKKSDDTPPVAFKSRNASYYLIPDLYAWHERWVAEHG